MVRAERQGKKGRNKRMEIRMEGGNKEIRKKRKGRKEEKARLYELHAYFASFKKYNLEGDTTASGTRGKALGSPLSVEAGQQGARERSMRLSGQTSLPPGAQP